MVRPRPVPPNLRVVLASACAKASKSFSSLSAGMPMPVSRTLNCSIGVASPPSASGLISPASAIWISTSTSPWSVNLTAFETRLTSTWRMRVTSPKTAGGTSSPT